MNTVKLVYICTTACCLKLQTMLVLSCICEIQSEKGTLKHLNHFPSQWESGTTDLRKVLFSVFSRFLTDRPLPAKE